jgi:hypothetical protein
MEGSIASLDALAGSTSNLSLEAYGTGIATGSAFGSESGSSGSGSGSGSGADALFGEVPKAADGEPSLGSADEVARRGGYELFSDLG